MKALKSLLSKRQEFKKISLTDKDIFYVFQRVIKEEFGNIGAGKLQADFFKNKTIFVKSSSSVWASELYLNQKKIIRKMQAELGEGAVKGIKTR